MQKHVDATNNDTDKTPSINLPPITVAELFAGVGGFRLGLEGYDGKSATSGYKNKLDSPYKTIFSNQWEPSKNKQIASAIYQKRFGNEGHLCKDIATLRIDDIPDHDMLVGGFPCQDFSIANRVNAGGLKGKKAHSGGRFTG
ncbi:DNA cytosine methyltransferase [Mucilaginibacter psychrotolerans]|uniref:DNA cytosine methyltransferase n=1 Tax=Mucilaginibacter psychrotolerans TaxID=1524096 RepID=UPI00195B2145|nr:DNA cytosine methyltransferase [Mucilaginibacter psychrotolerans]